MSCINKRKACRIRSGLFIAFMLITVLNCKQNNVENLYSEAQNFYENMNFESAEKKCNEILISNKSYFRAMLLKSKIMFNTGRKSESIKLLKKIVEKDPSFVDARLFFIKALIETDNTIEAEKQLNKALERNGNDYRIFTLYSRLGEKKQDLRSYIFFQKKAETCIKDASLIYLDLASIYKKFGMEDISNDYLEKARVFFGEKPVSITNESTSKEN